MAAGGSYNAPSAEDTRTAFGNETQLDGIVGGGGGGPPAHGVTNTPLFGDYRKHEDLKGLLDSSKDQAKLEAMRLIVGMVAKGKDCSDLFPSVVKNVVSKNSEIKKLVYVYLVRYAEEQQDLALLSISTFQKALKDPNQLIRASALRVLSSIRVPIIAPIMMLSIKESVNDMSPYVRKTAAHAIPKLYSLDSELKDQLVEVIEKLLKDQTTLVAGSVVMAFLTVCPDRIDLIHKNYRKLCNLLVDVDEWGQVMILNLLTRYARTQFTDPNKEELKEAAFYSDEDESSEDSSEDESEEEDDHKEETKKKRKRKPKRKPYVMDSDHRLLLKNSKPLLQSRNAAVVMAVGQLYHHIAPSNEIGIIVKPLIRLLKHHTEVQSIVLGNIATMSAERSNMFEPYLKSFFVHSGDPRSVKLLKLEIIANIAGETSIHTILREFRTYISSQDKVFAAATIHAIGRLACSISDVTETCLHGLMGLLSHKDETVVGESVVVIKKLLQLQPKENKDLIVQVAKLTDKVTVPMAKASILWLVGEYCSLVPRISPDVLRKAAKTFPDEPDIVKLQTINLAAKLCIANARHSKLLCQYVLNLAKYDQNYDVRDRARFLRQLVLPAEGTALSKYAKKILLASKPAPVLESIYKGRSHWQLGSLSHAIGADATGYIPLSDFPSETPDTSVRDVEDDSLWGKKPDSKEKKKKGFYSDSEEEEEDEGSGSDFYSSISGSEISGSEDSEEDSKEDSGSEGESEKEEATESEEDSPNDEDTTSEEEDALEKLQKRFGVQPTKKQVVRSSSDEDSEEDSDEDTEDTESDDESSSEEDTPPPTQRVKVTKKKAIPPSSAKNKGKSPVTSDLLDLDDWGTTTTSEAPPTSLGGGDMLTPLTSGMEGLSIGAAKNNLKFEPLHPQVVPDTSHELLNRITGQGLQVTYCFSRKAHLASSKMLAIKLTFQNTLETPLSAIKIGDTRLEAGMSLRDGGEIGQLAPGTSSEMSIGVDFNDTLQPAKFDICVGQKKFPVKIDPLVGELIRPARMSEDSFNALQTKLKGMHESSDKLISGTEVTTVRTAIMEAANLAQVPYGDAQTLKFASLTFASGLPVLVTVQVGSKVTVNSEKMVINSMLIKTIKGAVVNT